MRPKCLRERRGNGRAGGRGQFDRRTARIDRLARDQRGGGRRRHRQHAMLRLHRAAAEVERRAVDRVDAQQLETQARADDIGDRIHRADFVKMHFLDRHLVHGGFRLAQSLEHGRRHSVLRDPAATRRRSSSECRKDAGAWALRPARTWNLVAAMPQRFTFSKDTDTRRLQRAQARRRWRRNPRRRRPARPPACLR